MCCYALLLGRRPEKASIIQQYVGRPLISFISDIIYSEEFRINIDTIIQTTQIRHHHQLGSDEYKNTADWVAALSDSPPLRFPESWWNLLKTFIYMDNISSLFRVEQIKELQTFISKQAKIDSEEFSALTPLIALDKNWLKRQSNDVSSLVISPSGRTADELLVQAALKNNLQLLPAFSEGLEKAYQPLKLAGHVSIQDILDRMFASAKSGILSHWLFCNPHYRAELAAKDPQGQERKAIPEEALYLDFLARGEQNRLSPHPLFSDFAYRKNNSDLNFASISPFRHYLYEGCFDARPTSAIFDQEFYLLSNISARTAIYNGTHVSALHHFLTIGIFHDLPFCPDLDLSFYRERYPDVVAAIETGAAPSASWQFVFQGLREGRSPNPNFDPEYYRQRQPDVVDEMQRLGILSELEHFLMIGKARGYKSTKPLSGEAPSIDAAKAIFHRRARRSLNNVRQAPLDFSFDGSAGPAISVVIPVFNEIEFTSRVLECVYFAAIYFQHSCKRSVEIIVVDNGSHDGTDDLLRSCPGLRIVHFDQPIGFPRAVNAGVAASHGDQIIVANNDIEFASDTFLKVWRHLGDNESIGVLGGLIILPNETLQEAGSFVDSRGGVMGLGRYENTWDKYFQGLHTADYCTGSFIAFRRQDFDALGGLDEAFSPGYYEEVDFAFRMMDVLGKRAAVASDIQITHFEHASFGKGRPPTTAYATIKRNQLRFINKHRPSLARRPSPAALGGGQGVNPIAIRRTRWLVIVDSIPDPKLDCGRRRTFQLLASLAAGGVAFDLLALTPHLLVEEFNDARVTVYRNWMPAQDLDTILSTKSARYSHILICGRHNLTAFASRLEIVRDQHGLKIICDTVSLAFLQRLEVRRLAGEAITAAQEVEAVRLELEAPVGVSQWIAGSLYDKERIEAAGFGPVSVFSNRFESLSLSARPAWGQRTRILALGPTPGSDWSNQDGLIWFMEIIYPKCKAVFLDLRLTIVGDLSANFMQNITQIDPHLQIDFVGTVSNDELWSLYDDGRIVLAPARFSAELAPTLVEAMSLGVPVVMTDLLEKHLVGSALAAQTGLAVGLRSDDGVSFAQWVRDLSRDENCWREVQHKQVALAESLGGPLPVEDVVEAHRI